MTRQWLIAIVAVSTAAACSSWPSMPSMPSLPSLPKMPSISLKTEGPAEPPAIGCDAATRLNLQALDWLNAKQIDVQIRNAKFTPGILIMQVNTPNVVRVINGDKSERTFNAEAFFRSAAVTRIVYDGRVVSETCIHAIKVGPLKAAEMQIVPLRQGDYPFGEDTSTDLPLTPFGTPNKPGQIIVR